jgi:opacity protein-like surface antigen
LTSGQAEGGVVREDTVSAGASLNLTGKLTARLDTNVSWFDFLGVTASTPIVTTSTFNSNQRFSSVRPGLTYQILRPWGVSMAYSYEYTDYTDRTLANITDHRLSLGTSFALREWLVLGLAYRYGARRLHGNTTLTGVNEFTENQVSLTLTARPTLRF